MKKFIYSTCRRRQKITKDALASSNRIFTIKTDGTELPLVGWEQFNATAEFIENPEALDWSVNKKLHVVIPQHLSELSDSQYSSLIQSIKEKQFDGCTIIIECPLTSTVVRISEALIANADTVFIHTAKKTIAIKDSGATIHAVINFI